MFKTTAIFMLLGFCSGETNLQIKNSGVVDTFKSTSLYQRSLTDRQHTVLDFLGADVDYYRKTNCFAYIKKDAVTSLKEVLERNNREGTEAYKLVTDAMTRYEGKGVEGETVYFDVSKFADLAHAELEVVYKAVLQIKKDDVKAANDLRSWGVVLYAFVGVRIIVGIILCCKRARATTQEDTQDAQDSMGEKAKKGDFACGRVLVGVLVGVSSITSIIQVILFAKALGLADGKGAFVDVLCIVGSVVLLILNLVFFLAWKF